jgi:hypothetical protein
MNVHQIKNMTPEERFVTLEGENFAVQEQSYMKPLTDQELAEKRAELSQALIEISVIEDEFKTVKDQFKARLEPLKDQKTETLQAVKSRGILTKGKVYLMPDHENRVMHIVTGEGLVLDSRMMRPEERQLTIQHNQKSA